jgi:hypothetical protein
MRFQRITDAEASAVTQWSSAALMSWPPPAVSTRRLSVVCVAKSIAVSSESRSVEFTNEDFNGDGEMHSDVWFVTTGIGEIQWPKGKH